MDKPRIGINGFGRIGRAIFRINQKYNLFDIPIINDINPDIKNIAYLLKYDTTYGKASFEVSSNETALIIENKVIDMHHQQSIADVPWEKYDVDIVIDSSGIHKNLEEMQKCKGHVKNFIVTNIPNEVKHSIIIGCNENELDPKNNFIISSSICDAIATGPLLKIIGSIRNIESGFLTTLHPWLSYQNLVDGPSVMWSQPGDIFSHYSLGRSSPMNLIPKSTSAIKAVEMAMPHLNHKIISHSFRVPTNIVSGADLTLMLDKEISAEELIKKFEEFEKNQKYKIIRNSVEPLTSSDYRGEEFSAIIDHRWTKVNQGKLIKMVYWYDNEWGYSCRVLDLVKKIVDYYG